MASECSPSVIASDARCFTCVPEKALLGMQVYLLKAIANDMSTVQELMDASACYRDCMTGKALYGAMVYLLCVILETGGGGGGGGGLAGITTAAGPPPVDGSITTLFYKDSVTGFKYINLGTVIAPVWDAI